MTKSNILPQTPEDRLAGLLADIAAEHWCEKCGGECEAKLISNKYWRGVEVTCQDCGSVVAEIDGAVLE